MNSILKNTCLLALAATLFYCKRNPTREETEKDLKSAMSHFLNQRVNFDTTVAKFEVKTVRFFEDKDFYDCEFQVREKTPKMDTTGGMGAKISKDFSIVRRKY